MGNAAILSTTPTLRGANGSVAIVPRSDSAPAIALYRLTSSNGQRVPPARWRE